MTNSASGYPYLVFVVGKNNNNFNDVRRRNRYLHGVGSAAAGYSRRRGWITRTITTPSAFTGCVPSGRKTYLYGKVSRPQRRGPCTRIHYHYAVYYNVWTIPSTGYYHPYYYLLLYTNVNRDTTKTRARKICLSQFWVVAVSVYRTGGYLPSLFPFVRLRHKHNAFTRHYTCWKNNEPEWSGKLCCFNTYTL